MISLFSSILDGRITEGADVVTEGSHGSGLRVGGMMHVASEGEYGVLSQEDVEKLDLASCNPDIPVFANSGRVKTIPNLGEQCTPVTNEWTAIMLYESPENGEQPIRIKVGDEG